MSTAKEEVQRIKRVSDQLCTCHSILGDRFRRRAHILTTIIFASSTWMLALVFVEPTIGKKLSPYGIDHTLWIGVLSIITFFVSILELLLNWRECAERHEQSLEYYAGIKQFCKQLLSQDIISDTEYNHLQHRYMLASEMCESVSDRDFIKLKQKHLKKIALSKYLDKYPHTLLPLLSLRLFLKDTFIKLPKKSEDN